jgi:hypothetical protein
MTSDALVRPLRHLPGKLGAMVNRVREEADRLELTGRHFTVPTFLLVITIGSLSTVGGIVWHAAVVSTELRLQTKNLTETLATERRERLSDVKQATDKIDEWRAYVVSLTVKMASAGVKDIPPPPK